MALQVFILLIAVLLCSAPADSNHNLISSRCPEAERQALTDLKDAASDPANRLSSWSGTDCCQWNGVRCDNQTGHVIGLHLRNLHVYNYFVDVGYEEIDEYAIRNSSWALQFAKLPSSLLALNYLSYLDLSANYFKETAIPQFIGSFRELRYLNLSFTNLNGTIPSQLGRLSNLHTLSLLVDWGEAHFETLVLDNPSWLSGLRSLQHFEIRYTRLAAGWLQSLNMLPSLRQIRVYESSIDDDTLSLPHVNFTSLETLDLPRNVGLTSALFSWLPNLTHLQYLDLRDNSIRGSLPSEIWSMSTLEVLILSDNDIAATIPEVVGNLHRLQRLELSYISISGVIPASIGNLTKLRELYLDRNSLSGQIPDSIGNLNQLQLLDFSNNALSGSLPVNVTNLSSLKQLLLSRNSLNGPIPHSLGRLSRLEKLDLSANALTGTIPGSLGQLSQLVNLDLSNNSLSGIVTKSHFASLLNLKVLWMSDNSMLAINLSSGWRPPFDLEALGLRGCRVGHKFPSWIRTQRNMTTLDLSSTMISDSIPDWFWSRRSFVHLNLSHNEIHGRIPSSFQSSFQGWATIDLHSNLFDGPLPNDINNVYLLDLSDNRFTGTIPREMVKGLNILYLSNNNLTGPIPSSLCDADITELDLSGNLITGQLPNCTLSNILNILDLSNNHITGNIPDAFLKSSSDLSFLNLSNNSFTGELPSTLAQSKDLVILDLGNNRFRGEIPIWLDDSFGQLRVLSLSSNMLTGFLPAKTLSRVPNLHILDLSHNYLSGTIPENFGNFTAMMRQNDLVYGNNDTNSKIRVLLVIKGRTFEYGSLLGFLTTLDLSNNNLSGAIPTKLRNLTWLQNLNVAGNHLTGEITTIIGGMQRLESLDLSRNELSGLLPQTLANLGSLGFLNVSYNNFSGRIPSGGHLDTFNDPSIYMGNPYLYRDSPADQNQTNKTGQRENEAVDDNEDEIIWFYIGLAPGFVVGFWALFGVLVFKKTWRRAYFRAIDDVYDFLYVKVVVHHRKFKRSLQSRK